MITLLLADDHETVREGLRALLNAQPDMKVIGEAADGAAAIDLAHALGPDVVVLDLTMPHMNGLAAARALHQAAPHSRVIALTRHDDQAYVQELLAAGAAGYVLKQSSSAELVKAIRAAMAGGRYLDPALREAAIVKDRRRASTPPVTDRERDVLRRMAIGDSNKEIAAALDISVKTVEVHKANAMRKLGLRGRADVVRFAVLNGWLQDL